MSDPAQLSEQERADLVAYLDGELNEEAARTLEAKLSLYPAARAEADALRRTWELLDFLPRSQPSPQFTHRTLQRLTPVRADELRHGRRWRLRCFVLVWLAALLLSGWAGYASYNWFAPHPSSPQSQASSERSWLERLPKSVRDKLEKLPPAERAAQEAELRKQEQQQRILWQRPLGAPAHPKQPARPADLPAEARQFLEQRLLPHLTPEEKRQYESAKGRWPAFPQKVKELMQRHPLLPPLRHKTIARYEDLPEKARVEAGSKTSWERQTELWRQLQAVEGKWPEWALLFHEHLSQEQRKRMPPLGASRPSEFPPAIQTFIEQKLKPILNPNEKKHLHGLEGRWPEYPRRLLQLAEKHKLEVPGMSLPGGAELWATPR